MLAQIILLAVFATAQTLGQTERMWIGIGVKDAADFQPGVKLPAPNGPAIVDVEPDSPAQESGLQSGSLIIEIAKQRVKTVEALATELTKAKVGDEVEILLFERVYGKPGINWEKKKRILRIGSVPPPPPPPDPEIVERQRQFDAYWDEAKSVRTKGEEIAATRDYEAPRPGGVFREISLSRTGTRTGIGPDSGGSPGYTPPDPFPQQARDCFFSGNEVIFSCLHGLADGRMAYLNAFTVDRIINSKSATIRITLGCAFADNRFANPNNSYITAVLSGVDTTGWASDQRIELGKIVRVSGTQAQDTGDTYFILKPFNTNGLRLSAKPEPHQRQPHSRYF